MYVWAVKGQGHRIIWLDFFDAWNDFKARDGRAIIYFKFMRPATYEQLKEFEGF